MDEKKKMALMQEVSCKVLYYAAGLIPEEHRTKEGIKILIEIFKYIARSAEESLPYYGKLGSDEELDLIISEIINDETKGSRGQ